MQPNIGLWVSAALNYFLSSMPKTKLDRRHSAASETIQRSCNNEEYSDKRLYTGRVKGLQNRAELEKHGFSDLFIRLGVVAVLTFCLIGSFPLI